MYTVIKPWCVSRKNGLCLEWSGSSSDTLTLNQAVGEPFEKSFEIG